MNAELSLRFLLPANIRQCEWADASLSLSLSLSHARSLARSLFWPTACSVCIAATAITVMLAANITMLCPDAELSALSIEREHNSL